MKIYFPLAVFPIASEDIPVCDYIIQGFQNEQDAKDVYPDHEIACHEFPDRKSNQRNWDLKKKKLPKPDVYKILNECVERGIQGGWNRAHKHTDKPSEELIKQEIERYVMMQMDEYFKF